MNIWNIGVICGKSIIIQGGRMDKIIVAFDKGEPGVVNIINEYPYERMSMQQKIFAHLVVYVSEKNQEVTIIKNRYGTINDPSIISFFENLYGIGSPPPEDIEEQEPEIITDRFELMEL